MDVVLSFSNISLFLLFRDQKQSDFSVLPSLKFLDSLFPFISVSKLVNFLPELIPFLFYLVLSSKEQIIHSDVMAFCRLELDTYITFSIIIGFSFTKWFCFVFLFFGGINLQFSSCHISVSCYLILTTKPILKFGAFVIVSFCFKL